VRFLQGKSLQPSFIKGGLELSSPQSFVQSANPSLPGEFLLTKTYLTPHMTRLEIHVPLYGKNPIFKLPTLKSKPPHVCIYSLKLDHVLVPL